MIEGKYYLAGRSDFMPAKLYLQAGGFQLHLEGGATITGAIDQLSIADRLGNIARKITLPDDTVFETKNNDAIDSALANTPSSSRFMDLIHLLERNMALAIFSIFITSGVVFASFKWGLPSASHVVAYALPDSASQVLSDNIFEFLDDYFLNVSKIDKEKKNKLRQHFLDSVVPLYQAENKPEFKLHFRLWLFGDDKSIPNALALPSGDIIVTDRFIELAQSQDEIDIVLLHEMGHIVERHSLEQVIEGSAVIVAASMAFGDVSWLADLGVGIGSFLISSFYSRNHESEADLFAYEHSLPAKINPASLGLILTRMEQDMTMKNSSCDKTQDERSDSIADSPKLDLPDENNDRFSSYFSTHPSSADRIAMGKRYQLCFEQGLDNCPSQVLSE